MTPEEAAAHLAIRNTIATYATAGDSQRLSEFAATFAEDGVLDFLGTQLTGPKEIEDGMGGSRRSADNPPPDPRLTFSRHNVSSTTIKLDGDTATARSYFVVYTNAGPDHAGVYNDRLKCVNGEWLFAYRKVLIDWQSPQSLFRDMGLNSKA